jgi:predicted amidophosphoribosyltransferase
MRKRLCPKCKKDLVTSKKKGTTYFCEDCHEDFFSSEVFGNDIGTKIMEMR